MSCPTWNRWKKNVVWQRQIYSRDCKPVVLFNRKRRRTRVSHCVCSEKIIIVFTHFTGAAVCDRWSMYSLSLIDCTIWRLLLVHTKILATDKLYEQIENEQFTRFNLKFEFLCAKIEYSWTDPIYSATSCLKACPLMCVRSSRCGCVRQSYTIFESHLAMARTMCQHDLDTGNRKYIRGMCQM